ncbi:Cytidylate kinase [Desulfocicer vacuolatum DSM 3385]|uniref:Cytidylate kinase n=1 Tax=Desulfocicer vacuolatum DSM 3385 TaxID=1121400 RepID=A0A1W2CJN0_9BACT|nr:cytidylate kinase-like family protein [Desulfocicer vacuolatum]SMC85447.1 Cytidylate kinase [Desulfocicer vacuolatum DSM 3385]
MESKRRRLNQIIEEQVKQWEYEKKQLQTKAMPLRPVVSLSREPGSGGRIIAERLAKKLGFALFHQEVVHEMAKNADISVRFIETLDERRLNTLDNWIASLVDDRYLWPDQYLHHLMKVIGTIGEHGNSVVVGRGSNFILPPEVRISVRIIAPFEMRCSHVAKTFGLSEDEAGRRITKTQSARKSFIWKYFNASISDPGNYALLINTGVVSMDEAVQIIETAVQQRVKE